MHKRTRRVVAHFPVPFRLTSVDGLQPAGAYAVDREEEIVPGDFRVAYQCTGIFMHLPTIADGHWTIRSVPVTASEIEMAILEDAGLMHAAHRLER